MHQESSENSVHHSFQTVFFVGVESLLSLLLRFDDQLRTTAYPLATKGSLIVIRSYLPHEEIYLTFSFKGILLDTQMPEHKEQADVIINAHSFEILQALFSQKSKYVEGLQMRGESEHVELFKAFLDQMSINEFVKSNIKRLNNEFDEKNELKDNQKQPKIDYKLKYNDLKDEYYTLKNDNKRLNTHVAELESRKKVFLLSSIISIIIGLVAGGLVGYYCL